MKYFVLGLTLLCSAISCQNHQESVVNDYFASEFDSTSAGVDPAIFYLAEVTPKKIVRVVIHTTATPEGRLYPKEQAQRDWNSRGFGGVPGYHFLIHANGRIDTLRRLNDNVTIEPEEIVYGAKGYNTSSVHMCYVGGVVKVGKKFIPKDTRTMNQKTAISVICARLRKKMPWIKIMGHRDLPEVKKACPSFRVQDYYY